jgi:hypothetical protein
MRIIIEAEPGSAGIAVAEAVRRKIATALGAEVEIRVGTRTLPKAG